MSSKSILLFSLSVGLWGCDEPLKGEEAGNVLQACCQAASSRIADVNDVESSNFRKRCESCRRGGSKSQCEAAARKVQAAVNAAFRDELPLECTTMREGLAPYGISIPQNP